MKPGGLQQLHDLGILSSRIRGELIATAPFPALLRFFDLELLRIAQRVGAIEHRYPSALLRRQLEKLGFFEAFPHHATLVASRGRAGDVILTPAVCYHLYDLLERSQLPTSPLVVTACGTCFRLEKKARAIEGRLWSFAMREIIVAGSQTEVVRKLGLIARAVRRFLLRVQLPTKTVPATDSFFLGEARGRRVLQKLANLKNEIIYTTLRDSSLALGSINDHRDHFGRRMRIALPDSSTARTGCVAFGLERLALAFVDRHGTDRARWPRPVARGIAE
jgi:hypothetical protein